MKSLPDFHFTPSLIMIVLLLSIPDSIASSLQSNDSFGALKNGLVLETTIKPSSTSTDQSSYFLGGLDTIVGFASSIIGIYQFFDSLLNPAITPKFTADDVMKKMDAQFTQVMSDLTEIKAKLNKQEISAYREVEMAINGAYNDMYHKSTVDIPSRAVKLYDQLDAFMKGMLGNTNTLPDLLQTVRDLYDCGSKQIEKKMNEFIALVHVGTGGLAFYDRVINNKDIFNGNERVKKLSTNYDLIRERVKGAMKMCASLDKAVINKYISKILMVNQEDHVQTIDVSKLLYQRFDEIYQPVRPDIVWVFYTAWSFDAVSGDKHAGRYAQSYNMTYNGDGSSGVTINGGWTVIWVGHPLPAPAKWLDVKSSDLRDIIRSERGNSLGFNPPYRNAYALQKKMTQSLYSGRVPVFNLVLTNPPRKATIGTPINNRERINIWQKRIDDIGWFYYYWFWPNIPYWEDVTVDFIIF